MPPGLCCFPKDNDDNDDDAYPRLIGVILLRLSPEVLGLCYDVCEGAKRSPATENLFFLTADVGVACKCNRKC